MDMQAKFLVMGGECNYLYETVGKDDGGLGLKAVDGNLWKDGRGVRWSEDEITQLLDKAQNCLEETIQLLELPARVLRKERACGMINTSNKRFTYENLEEITLMVQEACRDCTAPHCAFNGGNDVWVDVGNKALGIAALQEYVGKLIDGNCLDGSQCLHVGDRFTVTGNDTRSRKVAMTAWVSNPQETIFIVQYLLSQLEKRKHGGC